MVFHSVLCGVSWVIRVRLWLGLGLRLRYLEGPGLGLGFRVGVVNFSGTPQKDNTGSEPYVTNYMRRTELDRPGVGCIEMLQNTIIRCT